MTSRQDENKARIASATKRLVRFRLARDPGYPGPELREILDASVQAPDAIFSGRGEAA